MALEECCVVVERVNGRVTLRELVQTCTDIGEIKEVIWREDSNGNQTGSAFILYK